MATGRSDYPNQVNNVLCFPFIFRGALDVGATTITREMEIAAVHALADLARREQATSWPPLMARRGFELRSRLSHPPKPFDPRLIVKIAPRSPRQRWIRRCARRPIADLDAYSERLQQFVYHSRHADAGAILCRRTQDAPRGTPAAFVYAEGEDERVLRAVQIAVDEKLAVPVLMRTAVGDRAAASSAADFGSGSASI